MPTFCFHFRAYRFRNTPIWVDRRIFRKYLNIVHHIHILMDTLVDSALINMTFIAVLCLPICLYSLARNYLFDFFLAKAKSINFQCVFADLFLLMLLLPLFCCCCCYYCCFASFVCYAFIISHWHLDLYGYGLAYICICTYNLCSLGRF